MPTLAIAARIAVVVVVCLVFVAFVGPWWGIGLAVLIGGGYARQARHRATGR